MDAALAWGAAALVLAGSFLLGSIPWGVIVSRLGFGKDIRDEGSGNIGATNALRALGKAGGTSVFLLDFGKGLASGLLAMLLCWTMVPGGGLTPGAEPAYETLLALAFVGSVWGHVFSPWLHFKGGKGVSVAIGCLFVLFGVVGALIELAVFVVVVAATRYVSAGSIAAAAACPLLSLCFLAGCWPAIAIATLAAATVIWAHRENIARLRSGTERKVGKEKEGKRP